MPRETTDTNNENLNLEKSKSQLSPLQESNGQNDAANRLVDMFNCNNNIGDVEELNDGTGAIVIPKQAASPSR